MRCTIRRRMPAVLLAGAVIALAAGCSTLTGAIAGMVGGRSSAQTPGSSAESAPQPDTQAEPEPARESAQAAQAYQYQFDAFYRGLWNVGWFGYGDQGYKPGQGTVWEFANTGDRSEPTTFERAYLRANADGSQWWRLGLESGKDALTFEFLVGGDGLVQKVRYRDPDSKAVGEFVPSQQRPSGGEAGGPSLESRADLARYKVDTQTVRVRAGSFASEHYLYTDGTGDKVEAWVSDSVPGSMVKIVYTANRDGSTSTAELVKIENGVTTELGSY